MTTPLDVVKARSKFSNQ